MIAPKVLYRIHGALTMRMFDGRGLRIRHAIALGTTRWLLDRFECDFKGPFSSGLVDEILEAIVKRKL